MGSGMTQTERLNELLAQAEDEGLDISGLEVWEPFALMLAVGELLGLGTEAVMEPITAL